MAATAEQEEKLSMLMAFAGDTVDADLAKVMLESAGWDVERALNGLLEEAEPSSGYQAPAAGPTPPDSSRAGMVEEQASELSTEDLRALLEAYDVDHSKCLSKTDLVNLLEKTVGNAGQTPTEAQPPARQPLPFFPLDAKMVADMYSQPSTRASSRDREPPADDFPENWGHRLKMICDKFPSVPRAQVVALLKKHTGAACVVEHDLQEIVRVKEEQAAQNAERQAEIAMQNEEFHESLLMDQHRELQLKEELELKEVQRKSAEEVERKQSDELKRKQAEDAQANREAEVAFEAKRSRVDQPEPDKAHPDRCQIVIRTPSGKRLNRTFLGSDEVSFIYDWIDVACVEEDFVKESYKIVARCPGQPTKELCKSQQSLKDEGVEHQTVFMISSS